MLLRTAQPALVLGLAPSYIPPPIFECTTPRRLLQQPTERFESAHHDQLTVTATIIKFANPNLRSSRDGGRTSAGPLLLLCVYRAWEQAAARCLFPHLLRVVAPARPFLSFLYAPWGPSVLLLRLHPTLRRRLLVWCCRSLTSMIRWACFSSVRVYYHGKAWDLNLRGYCR